MNRKPLVPDQMNKNPRVDPAVQQQIDYNDRISSRSFMQNNQTAKLNIRDKNMVKMPKNNNAFLDDRNFTDYNIKGSQTQNFVNTTHFEQQQQHTQPNNFGPYSEFNHDKQLQSSHNKPKKNIDLEYDMRIPTNRYDFRNDTTPGKIPYHTLDRKGRREYEHKYVMSTMQN